MPAVLRLVPAAMSISISTLRQIAPSLLSNPNLLDCLLHATHKIRRAVLNGQERRQGSGSDGVDRHLRPRVVARPAAAAAKELTERPISRCGGGSRATPTLPPHTPCARVPSRRHGQPSPEPVGGTQLPSPAPSGRGAAAPSSLQMSGEMTVMAFLCFQRAASPINDLR